MQTLVLGLDGATSSVLNPLFQAGYMPNLHKAIHRGSFGELRSTIPPVTALAWPSFFTGLNPGKHGLFGWQLPINSDNKRTWINSHRIHGTKIWQVLNQSGLRVFVVNVPVTYPPDPINGGMISGMLTPNLDASFTFPLSLKQELLKAIPNYQIDIDVQRSQPNLSNIEGITKFLQKSRKITHARSQAIQWIIQNKKPDVVFVVFEIMDRLQHFLWPNIAALPGSFDETQISSLLRNELLQCFNLIDDEIGALMNYLPVDGNSVILSDHGFGEIKTVIHMNDLLENLGWLSYKKTSISLWNMARNIGARIKHLLPGNLLWKVRNSLPIYHTFQWEKTSAHSGSPSEHGIFINLQGREVSGIISKESYEAIRSDIIESVRNWQNPQTSIKPFTSVYRREEVYQGPFVSLAPDIIFELEPGYAISDLKGREQIDILEDLSKASWGGHERAGIFAISGKGVKVNFSLDHAHTDATIMDVMPTLLYLLDIKIPEGLDGKVLFEAFSSEHKLNYPPKYHKYGDRQDVTIQQLIYSEEESALLEDRLRGLGYL